MKGKNMSVSKKAIIASSLSIITLSTAAILYFGNNKNQNNTTTPSTSISELVIPSESSTKIESSSSNTEQTTVEQVPGEHIYTPEEIVSIITANYFTRSNTMNIDKSKEELRKIIVNDDNYNYLINVLTHYHNHINKAIETKTFATWDIDNPELYPYALSNDKVLNVDEIKKSENNVYSTMIYIQQDIPDGTENQFKGYVKLSFMLDEKGKIVSLSESQFIDEKTLN